MDMEIKTSIIYEESMILYHACPHKPGSSSRVTINYDLCGMLKGDAENEALTDAINLIYR